ncbi:hypothetical protein D4764_04G0009710 [Takifugu flavidus]|uniref:Uncharacterized protein n=1 Tax=Takifugu flavidus TaxID=433684 RepID=A0A5C6N4D5_9TELE|nr:hypothetical protein D4764_04G0009710 [Takifugu flavidus]
MAGWVEREEKWKDREEIKEVILYRYLGIHLDNLSS